MVLIIVEHFMRNILYFLTGVLLFFTSCNQNKKNQERSSRDVAETTKERMVNTSFPYDRQEVSSYIEQWVDSSSLRIDLPKISESNVAGDLFAFYQERDFAPAWNEQKADELARTLEELSNEGLSHAYFPLDSLKELKERVFAEGGDAREGAGLDLLLSATYLKLAETMAMGKVKPGEFYADWHIKPESPDTLSRHLQEAISGKGVEASLDYLRPQFDQYEKLQEFIKPYRTIIEEGGWPRIAAGPDLQPGDSSQRVVQLRRRLYKSQDLKTAPSESAKPAVYDSLLLEAVKQYQQRNGLEVRPEVKPEMIEAMNVPAEMRLKQILLNMDRIRWFSSGDFGETYVLVNIPEYRLRVFEQGTEIKNMKVVVGEVVNSTPIFSDYIEYAIFSPYWNIPKSIKEEEIWPKAKEDPDYLSKNNYEVLDGWGDDAQLVPPSEIDWDQPEKYRVRQQPGPTNALGRVKFMFPNEFAIYLHDTPADDLFDEQHRAFSHGCIRIEDPAWFADWLFPQYNLQEVKQKMNNEEREVVQLDEKVPVYIFYLTAFVDEEGRLNFREDLYELDKQMAAAFDAL